jgi:hypothetical protein
VEPCERFTILDWRPDDDLQKCDVCDHVEASHDNPGRRRLSGGEIEALRRRLIEAMFDKQQGDGGQGVRAGGNGNAVFRPPGTNSEPNATDA